MIGYHTTSRNAKRERLIGASRAMSVLLASCAVAAGSALAGAIPQAAAGPTAPQRPGGWATGWPDPKCEGPTQKPMDLWDAVKDATPTDPKHNEKVVFPGGPNDRAHGYAIHYGAAPTASANDHLLVATIREQGIECHNLLDSGAPEYFHDAYDNIGVLPNDTDWALGIESADNRGRDQLHIHISRLQKAARTDVDNAAKSIPTNESGWTKTVITVMNKKFRAWNAPNLDHNLFLLLHDQIVKPLQNQKVKVGMANETLLVTKNKKGSGVIVPCSDKVSPDTKPNGVNNIELLLNKAAK